jgi:hypothetical protein
MTNTQMVLVQVKKAALCDDCISAETGVKPRQQVNQICRRMSKAGEIRREKRECQRCHKDKLVNFV